MSDRVDTYEPLVHEVSATARMGAHSNGSWVKVSDYAAALRRAEEAERKLAESEGYPGIAKDLEDCRTKLAEAEAERDVWQNKWRHYKDRCQEAGVAVYAPDDRRAFLRLLDEVRRERDEALAKLQLHLKSG